MNIICERENCKHRRINNSIQNFNICGKEIVRIGATGRCKSFEKEFENFQAVCTHPVLDRKWKDGKFIKFCTKCRKVIDYNA